MILWRSWRCRRHERPVPAAAIFRAFRVANDLSVRVTLRPSFDGLMSRFGFTPKQVEQIGVSAGNRSLTTVRASVVRRLGAKINITQTEIKKSVLIDRFAPGKLQGSVEVIRKPIPLFAFRGTYQTRAGVSVLVDKDRGREILKGTFIATMKSGHEGVFERGAHAPTEGPNAGAVLKRRGKYGRVAGDPRYFVIPGRESYRSVGRFVIVERFGLTLTGYLSHAPEVVADEQAKAGDILRKNLLSQIKRRLAMK